MKQLITIISIALVCVSCQEDSVKNQKFSSLFSNSSSINASYSSGTYSNDSLTINFSSLEAGSLVAIYQEDSIFSKSEAIELTIANLSGELSQIPSSSGEYIHYNHGWQKPIGKASSFHQVKILQINEGIITDSLIGNYILGAKKLDKLPIANFQADREWLFNSDSGCYVSGNSFDINNENASGNYYKFKKRKQQGSLQVLDAKHEYVNGVFPWRIHGLMTPKAPQKSLRFYLQKPTKVNALLDVRHEVDKIILRSAYSGWGTELFVDGFIATACKDLNVDVMAYTPVKVYLNGEYWGIHGLRERMDLKAIANKYGIKKKKLIEADDKGYSSEDKKFGELNVLFERIKTDPNYSYDSVVSYFEMSSLIDWLIIEMFFQNGDWPSNNTFFWKQKGKNHKWKCVLIDMDASVGHPEDSMFESAIDNNSKSLGKLFVAYLFNQKPFVDAFTKRALYLIENDFSSNRLLNTFTSYKVLFEPAVEEHFDRWGDNEGLGKYNKGINRIQTFCEQRQDYFQYNLNEFIKSKSF